MEDNPHPLLAAWPQCGHEVWVQKQDTIKEQWPSTGRVRSPGS